jgi:hypothetical protein
MIWLLCTALVMLSGCFVMAPLFGKRGSPDSGLFAETELDRLMDRKTVIDEGLNDLEFEFKMGRLSEADFKQIETSYKEEAAVILQKIEQAEKEKGNRKSLGRSSAKCPACGADVVSKKKFCADCGHKF